VPREAGGEAWLELRWVETGGPPVPNAPGRLGFGSRVVTTTVERQLGGEVRFDWAPEGLRCLLTVPAVRLLQPQGLPAELTLAGRPPDRPGAPAAAPRPERAPGQAPAQVG
jgi:hypothetical protein